MTTSILLAVLMLSGLVAGRGVETDDRDISRALSNRSEVLRHRDEREDSKRCPMRELGEAIEAIASTFTEKEGGGAHVEALQKYLVYKYNGSWAVIVSEYKSAVSQSFHWRIPAVRIGRKQAFCIKSVGYWMYCTAKVR